MHAGDTDATTDRLVTDGSTDVPCSYDQTEEGADDDVSMQSLQQEIKKLHVQLAASKAEAWSYKRQLLKQFL